MICSVRTCTEEQDWERLFADLLPKVADLVLLSDVKDYVALRAVCKPWRAAATDPKLMGMDPRFFPRHWEMAEEGARTGEKARFVNHLTGGSITLKIPREYGDVVATAEGLLVLVASGWEMRLFNPVTRAVSDLPSVFLENPHVPIEWKSAGMVYDDGEADPAVVLYVKVGRVQRILSARPGDAVWRVSQPGEPLSECGLSVRGRFYLPTPRGDVVRYRLWPLPHFNYVARQEPGHRRRNFIMRSFLLLARDGIRMQLVREILGGDFTVDDILVEDLDMDTGAEVFWVNVVENSLTLVQQQDVAEYPRPWLTLGLGSDA